jgi:hypothetical protein
MPLTRQAKIVFDGREYWVLWNWQSITVNPSPTSLTHAFSHVTGPFDSPEQASAVAQSTEGWSVVPFIS